jgi:hypothetical protein
MELQGCMVLPIERHQTWSMHLRGAVHVLFDAVPTSKLLDSNHQPLHFAVCRSSGSELLEPFSSTISLTKSLERVSIPSLTH